jgi:aryl-alcohol dehydrogenase-like predicted oxidoreductase
MWGVKLSEVGFGTWLTLNDADEATAAALHRTAYENGINFFDTANAYGRGRAEELVGKALKPFRRETYVLATKLFWPYQPDWPFPEANDRGLSRKQIFEQCHLSLKRMHTDYIDLYQCHRYDPNTPLVETCRAMNDIIDQGKVLYWGVSEWKAEQIAEAAEICDEHDWHRPVSDQPLYNMIERHWEQDAFQTCARLGMGIVTFSPLCEGLLTGKYNDGIPAGTRASHERYGEFIKARLNDKNLGIVRKLTTVAEGLNVPMATLALAWILRRKEVTSVIIGASKSQQIIDNVKASDLVLDEPVLERIEAILGG